MRCCDRCNGTCAGRNDHSLDAPRDGDRAAVKHRRLVAGARLFRGHRRGQLGKETSDDLTMILLLIGFLSLTLGLFTLFAFFTLFPNFFGLVILSTAAYSIVFGILFIVFTWQLRSRYVNTAK